MIFGESRRLLQSNLPRASGWGRKRRELTNARMHGGHHVGEGRGPDKEVDQRQARWLHALSCLIALTGNRGELFGLVMTRARRLVGIVGRGG